MAAMEENSEGRLRFRIFWSGALVGRRHTVQEIAAGVADMGVISPILSRAGMDLIQGQLTFYDGVPSRQVAEEIFWKLWEKFPQLQAELEGVHVIAINSGSPMYVLTTEQPVHRIQDLSGLRLKTTADKVRPLSKLGVDAVPMPMGEAYVALHRGILDGAIAPADTLKLVRFDEVMRYLTLFPTLRPPYPSRAINSEVWDSLPKDLQQMMADSTGWWSSLIREETEAVEAASLSAALHPTLLLEEAGLGCSVVPWSAIHDRVRAKRLSAHRIHSPRLTSAVSLVHALNKPPSQASIAVMHLVRQAVREAHEFGQWRGARPISEADKED